MREIRGKSTHGNLLISGLVAVLSFMVTVITSSYVWKEWLLLAIVISALYFSGMFCFFPWKTIYAKGFSIGVFLGMLLPTMVFVRGLA
jgi:hypothetical protein